MVLSWWPHRCPTWADLPSRRQDGDGCMILKSKRVFLLMYCLPCIAFAAWWCVSCRFPGRWLVSSWPGAVTVCHLISETQSFANDWGFFLQTRVQFCQLQQAVIFKLRKGFLKQLLKVVVFFSLVYLLLLRSFCRCSLQLRAKLWGQQLVETHSCKSLGDAGTK